MLCIVSCICLNDSVCAFQYALDEYLYTILFIILYKLCVYCHLLVCVTMCSILLYILQFKHLLLFVLYKFVSIIDKNESFCDVQ